jgi:hypothetical protein
MLEQTFEISRDGDLQFVVAFVHELLEKIDTHVTGIGRSNRLLLSNDRTASPRADLFVAVCGNLASQERRLTKM